MSKIIKRVVSMINHASIWLSSPSIKISSSELFLSRISSQRNNAVNVSNSIIKNFKATINGEKNSLIINNSYF